jgi:DNA-binding PadR family transcriptional regulator
MQSNNPSEDILDRLILDGMVEVAGIDSDTGDMLYSFTEKAREELPEVRDAAEAYFNSIIMYFWENDFISMNLEDENPVVRLKDKAFDESQVELLSSEMKTALNLIKDALRID